jgi:hypothetical protein
MDYICSAAIISVRHASVVLEKCYSVMSFVDCSDLWCEQK